MLDTTRTKWLLSDEGVSRLARAHVCVVGIGGVGGHACEALVRAGVGRLTMIDHDQVAPSNLNRQACALHSTLGMYKTHAMKLRLLDINPDAEIVTREEAFLPENADTFDFSGYDYVIDAIDHVGAKIALVLACREAHTPIISAMGAGGKLDPTAFRVADISKTAVCPLAKAVRLGLRRHGVNRLRVVYSEELPAPRTSEDDGHGKTGVGSLSFVPSVMGMILAGEAIKAIARNTDER